MCDTSMYTRISGYVQFYCKCIETASGSSIYPKKLDILDFRTVLEQLWPENTESVTFDGIQNDQVWAK